MARIIFGIQSDGLGHYPRSKLVIDHLISKGHIIKVLTADRVYDLMKGHYDVEKIERITSIYKNNGVSYIRTLHHFISRSPKRMNNIWLRIRKIFDNFKPDLVISDIEMLSAKVAIMKKTPLIYMGNSYSLSHTDAIKNLDKGSDKILKSIGSVLNLTSPNSKYVINYLITSFFNAKIKPRKKGKIIPPLIRNEIINLKPKNDGHILVYQTTNTNGKLASILKQIPNEKFIIYAFDKNLKDGNLEFKKTSVKNDFIHDLANCKAIITNGGFSLITEGLFLGKPILSNPVSRQIEQTMNAVKLEKLGYGKHVRKLTPDAIKSFLYDFNHYKKNLKKYKQKDNSKALEIIDKEIGKALGGKLRLKKRI